MGESPDRDGDGRAELLVADERVITVYRWQEGIGPVSTGVEFRTAGAGDGAP